MNNSENIRHTFNSIEEISLKRENVLSEIRESSTEIGLLWKDLFRREEPKKKGLTFSTLMNTGSGLIDGFLLAWKLYHKFKR